MVERVYSWDELSQFFSESLASNVIERGFRLGDKTTYRSGGACSLFIEVESTTDLHVVADKIRELGLPVVAIGNGSNLLVSDSGYDGLVLKLGSSFSSLLIEKEVLVAGGAANLPIVARKSVAAGLTGFEWAVGVPGSMGGAVRMNAGGHGSDMSKCVKKVEGVDLKSGKPFSWTLNELEFSYRDSAITKDHVITEVTLGLLKGDMESSEIELSEIVRWRIDNQPGGQNAGSVFTNPTNDSAGRLIDAAGCKGLRVGTACVSDKHANFIQVDHGGSSEDVMALIGEVRSRVQREFGIELIPENHFLGFS